MTIVYLEIRKIDKSEDPQFVKCECLEGTEHVLSTYKHIYGEEYSIKFISYNNYIAGKLILEAGCQKYIDTIREIQTFHKLEELNFDR